MIAYEKQLAEDIKAFDDLHIFIRASWHVLEPNTPFVDGKHIEAICKHLQSVQEGHIKRLLINMPPRHMKSTIVSVMWPVWMWLHDPSLRFLCSSYALSLAIRDNRKCRLLIQSPWFQSRYGSIFQFSGDQNVKGRFENDKRGYRLAVSVGSSATGEGGDILLIDDPHNIDEKESDIKREATLDWFDTTWSTRLNNQQTGASVVVGQRIHVKDLSGHILEQGGCVHLNLPAEYDPGSPCRTYLPGKIPAKVERKIPSFTRPGVYHTVTFSDGKATNCTCEDHTYHPEKSCKHMQSTPAPLPEEIPFWQDWRTIEGQLLWAERFPHSVLDEQKRKLGSLGYAALYQQQPVPAGGHIFQKQHERLFTIDHEAGLYLLQTPDGIRAVPMSQCALHITSDVAAKAKEQSDFTVFAVWAVTPHKEMLLLHILHAHLTIPKQVEEGYKVYLAYADDRFQVFWFEDVAYQSALGQFLLEKGVPVMPFYPKGDKVLRATGASIWMQIGNVYFLAGASWLEDWRAEIYQFPKGAHDDQVDVFSGMYIVIRTRSTPLSDDTVIDEQLLVPEVASSDGLIPITEPIHPAYREGYVPAQVQPAKEVDPFKWAASRWGDDW